MSQTNQPEERLNTAAVNYITELHKKESGDQWWEADEIEKNCFIAGAHWHQSQEVKPSEDDDKRSFELLEEYDMTGRLEKTIEHALTKVPESNRKNFIVNLCNGMVGSAILHYRNKYENKLNVKPFNQQV